MLTEILKCGCGEVYDGWYPGVYKGTKWEKVVKEPPHCKKCSARLSDSIMKTFQAQYIDKDFKLKYDAYDGWYGLYKEDEKWVKK